MLSPVLLRSSAAQHCTTESNSVYRESTTRVAQLVAGSHVNGHVYNYLLSAVSAARSANPESVERSGELPFTARTRCTRAYARVQVQVPLQPSARYQRQRSICTALGNTSHRQHCNSARFIRTSARFIQLHFLQKFDRYSDAVLARWYTFSFLLFSRLSFFIQRTLPGGERLQASDRVCYQRKFRCNF